MRKVAVLFSGSSYNVKFSLPTQLKNLVEPNDADVFVFTTKLCKRRKTEHNGEIPDASENDKWNEKVSHTLLDEHNLRQSEIQLIKETFGERLKGFAIAEDDLEYMEYLAQEREKMMDIINRYIDESYYLKVPAPFRGIKLTGANNQMSNGTLRCVIDQYRHLKKCYEMMEEYELENGIKYEWVVRARIDFVVPEVININHYAQNHDQPYLYIFGSFRREEFEWMDEHTFFTKRVTAEKLFPNLSKMGHIHDRKYQTIQRNTPYAPDGNDFMFDPECQFSVLLHELKLTQLIHVPIYRSACYTDGKDGFDYMNYIFRRDRINLEREYELCCKCETDINQHLPVLKSYAEKCDGTIVEIGVRYGNSTIGFMASRPKRFVSFDVFREEKVDYLELIAKEAGVNWEFILKNPTDIENNVSHIPDDTQLLFIDTNHNVETMTEELRLHPPKVSKYIILHDVFVFWNRGQGYDNGGGGLKLAVEPFLAEHPEWQVIYRTDRNNGLMILERVV